MEGTSQSHRVRPMHRKWRLPCRPLTGLSTPRKVKRVALNQLSHIEVKDGGSEICREGNERRRGWRLSCQVAGGAANGRHHVIGDRKPTYGE